MALVLDTGPIIAAMNRRDPRHTACHSLLSTAEALVVPSPVLVEIGYVLGEQAKPQAFLDFLAEVEGGTLQIEDLTQSDYARVAELYETYADLPVGFVDAAVLTVVERLGEPKLATLDHRHFTVMRPRHVEALELLPE